jgi:hypothetical protein
VHALSPGGVQVPAAAVRCVTGGRHARGHVSPIQLSFAFLLLIGAVFTASERSN